MRRRKNMIIAIAAGLGLFALGMTGLSTPVEEPQDQWLVAYQNAMETPDRH